MGYTLQFRDIWLNIDLIKEGLIYTVVVSIVAIVIGLMFGIVAAACRTSGIRVLSTPATVYVEVFRNTPLLIQLWLFYFGLVQLGINLSALTCGVLALGINTGAYTGEVIRAGFQAIDKEIIDASASLGFNPWQTLIKIKIPLAIRTVMPAIGNVVIQCLLATSLLSVLGINELTNQALRLASKTYRSFESFITVGILYIILTFAYSVVVNVVNRRINKGALH
jgi:His/Glu/Gln/Arg/opine family amino acid ABC transporter permease subunit